MPLCLQFMIVERRGSSGPQTFEGKVCIALHRKRVNLLLKNQVAVLSTSRKFLISDSGIQNCIHLAVHPRAFKLLV